MAQWKVIETRSNLVTVERQGSAGMASIPPSALGLTNGHDIALGTSVYGSEGGFSLDPAPVPQADPGDETKVAPQQAADPGDETDAQAEGG